MRSKEEILKSQMYYSERWISPKVALSAMEEYADEKLGDFIYKQNSFTETYQVQKQILDQYAKEVAIEFGRWIDANGINFEHTGFTPELFNQFLQEIKQDK